MELIDEYLNLNFISEGDFLVQNKCSHSDLLRWQENKILPTASYTTNNNAKITSFFGTFDFNSVEKWYPIGLCEWVCQIKDVHENPSSLKDIFFKRYKNKINELNLCGLSDCIYKNESEFSVLLESEWQHFLNGTYGVCTKDSSPEHIAVKDMTIRIIDRVTNKQRKESVLGDDLKLLTISVNLLDAVSSPFAPHERNRSSRKRCVELVREKYIN
ncbi:TPA: DUF6058 family natural product biosynthesis protein [Citrobacter braakii]|uniref:DUF6058 family natural product biosynthesis protein n=1 Tax=Citrobacter sp. Cm038 TaxID=2985117 RepID=UPI00257557E6|nr:DUF6058 family natural product biosynthesis protein [Citrobacter sp. Cm038]MDM2942352.1 DUF6058 family natural product biosynthesis protein [Citrobacter sp. Cm038]